MISPCTRPKKAAFLCERWRKKVLIDCQEVSKSVGDLSVFILNTFYWFRLNVLDGQNYFAPCCFATSFAFSGQNNQQFLYFLLHRAAEKPCRSQK